LADHDEVTQFTPVGSDERTVLVEDSPPPGTITPYRLPILAVCASREVVPARVLKVLGHEVGHAMGISEAELRELGWF